MSQLLMIPVKFLLAFCLLSLFSCDEGIVDESRKLQVAVPQNAGLKLSNFIDTVKTVKLDREAILGSIEKVVYKKEIFFVGDFNNTKSICLFDNKGALLRTIKCKEKIGDFVVDDKGAEIHILSDRHVLTYDIKNEGEALYITRLPFYATAISLLSEKRFCFKLHKSQSSDKFQSEFLVTDQNFEIVDNYWSYDDACPTGFYSMKKSFNDDNLNLTFLRKFDSSVYTLEADRMVKKLTFEFGENSAPFELGTTCHEDYLSSLESHDIDRKVLGIDNYYTYANSVYATYVYNNYVHGLHYDLNKDEHYSYSLGDVENDMFGGDFYFTVQTKYSDNEFVFINEPLYNDVGLPENPSLIVASFKNPNIKNEQI